MSWLKAWTIQLETVFCLDSTGSMIYDDDSQLPCFQEAPDQSHGELISSQTFLSNPEYSYVVNLIIEHRTLKGGVLRVSLSEDLESSHNEEKDKRRRG